MDKQDKEPKGTAATASKMATNKKPGESPAPNQGATGTQNQGGAGAQQNQGGAGAQQNKGTQNQNAGNQDLLQQAKQTTNEVVSQVQQQASSQLNRQKETAASELTTVVNAVRRFGETLNTEGQGPIARFAAQYGDKAANSLDRVAKYIREQDPKQVMHDVQDFGRRQPALLIGGAFLLGLAGARLIKSTMDASGSTYKKPQGFANTGGSVNPGSQQPQAFKPPVSGAQQPSPPLNRA